jgi:hypothetical protein
LLDFTIIKTAIAAGVSLSYLKFCEGQIKAGAQHGYSGPFLKGLARARQLYRNAKPKPARFFFQIEQRSCGPVGYLFPAMLGGVLDTFAVTECHDTLARLPHSGDDRISFALHSPSRESGYGWQ